MPFKFFRLGMFTSVMCLLFSVSQKVTVFIVLSVAESHSQFQASVNGFNAFRKTSLFPKRPLTSFDRNCCR